MAGLIAAIWFLDSSDALSSKISLALILLTIIVGLSSVNLDVILGYDFTKGPIKSGVVA